MAKHGEWIEVRDTFGDPVLIRRSAVIGVYVDIAGNTVIDCGSYKAKVPEKYNKVARGGN